MCPVRFGNSFDFDSFFYKHKFKNAIHRNYFLGFVSYMFIGIKIIELKKSRKSKRFQRKKFCVQILIFLTNKNLQKICLCGQVKASRKEKGEPQ